MKTFGVRYLGSKNKIIPYILDVCEKLPITNKTVLDVFTGTTRVAQAFRQKGWKVITSDLAWASECYSNAFICSKNNKHLQPLIDELNSLQGYEGWITRNYCDVESLGNKVRVWQRHNGMKADAIRDRIETFNLEKWEKDTLITSLIFALDKVDNTVGIQQAYLKEWKSERSLNNIFLELPEVIKGPQGQHLNGNVLDITLPTAEVAYIDPPYTSADYSTYYHIWDSITRWDKPKVLLKTNRRIDRVKSSDKHDKNMVSSWYSKKTAFESTKVLFNKLKVKYVVFSYSNEGLISFNEMKTLGHLIDIREIEHKRHVMSSIGCGANPDAHKKNIEFIMVFEKNFS